MLAIQPIQRLRELLHTRPALTAGVAGGVTLLCVVVVLARLFFGGRLEARYPKAWYSDDDGTSVFADRSDRLAPFEHKGRPAVRAYVLSPDGGRTRVISYLERYNDDARRAIEERARHKASGDPKDENRRQGEWSAAILFGTQVKRPGDPESAWVSAGAGEAMRVKTAAFAEGEAQGQHLEPVAP